MTIARVIQGRSGQIVSCDASISVGDAVKILAEQRIGALPVYADGQNLDRIPNTGGYIAADNLAAAPFDKPRNRHGMSPGLYLWPRR